jgi:serine/threonine-protein kinase
MNPLDPPPTAPPQALETPLEELWQRWKQDQRPDRSEAAVGASQLSADEMLAVLRYDQCQRWRTGDHVPAEWYLQAYSVLKTDPDQALVLIYGEYLLRQELGEKPCLDEYVRRFPSHAERLREQDEFHREVGGGSWLNAVAPPSLPLPKQAGACRIVGEVGRGGMGVILKGHDETLGRDLAVKVLRDEYRDRPEVVNRFLEEAQVSGQLQHPGVVPIHELGRFADGRPYFTMKLVQGRTLVELLAERTDPVQDRPRFLKIFEQVCQTIAYAHSKGVIHRDLKPANVMVGAFGEVQVMDWGLAKVLDRASRRHQPTEAEGSAIQTVRSGHPELESRAGAVVGTPAYMAPEQARGEVGRLDERCDVFGLGAILCEILTGQPPYVGHKVVEVLNQAERGDLAGALARLDGCGADAELLALARACLAAAPEDRPWNAGAVAEGVTAYLAGVQERLRQAEVERAAAQARVEEAQGKAAAERRARRLTAGLAAAGLVVVVLVGGGWLWLKGQREARAAAFRVGRDQATRLLEQGMWGPARVAVKALPEPDDEANRRWVREFLADLDILERLTEIRAGKSELFFDFAEVDAAYAKAFRDYGTDIEGLSTEEAVARIHARPREVVNELVAALMDWTNERGKWKPDSIESVRAVARAADQDPWRNHVRGLVLGKDFAALRKIAEDPAVLDQPPQNLDMLANTLATEDVEAGVALLRRAQRRYPGDVWINFHLAMILERIMRPPRVEEAIGYYRAAVAVRPLGMGNQLAKAFATKGDLDEALILYRELARSQQANARVFNNLGVVLRLKGQLPESLAALDEAVRLRPDYAEGHTSRGITLTELRRYDEALAALDEALRLKPNHARAHYNRGINLAKRSRIEEALAAFDAAVRSQPDFAEAHLNRGAVLYLLDRLEEAVASLAKAVQLQPDHALGNCYLGLVLQSQGHFADALKALRRGHQLGAKAKTWAHPSERWVRTCELLIALDERLPAVLKGEDRPSGEEEQLGFARVCLVKKLYGTSARLFEEVSTMSSKWADDPKTGNRCDAACAAAQAGCGPGKDEPPLDEPARARWRKQALDWLRADLARWTQVADSTPQNHAAVQKELQRWQYTPRLAGLRDETDLAKLPEGEREAWRKFWAEVETLGKRTSASKK